MTANVAGMSGVKVATDEENKVRVKRAQAPLSLHKTVSGVCRLVLRKHLHPRVFNMISGDISQHSIFQSIEIKLNWSISDLCAK